MNAFLPGAQVQARGLLWEIVHVEPAGEQTRFRLRCAQGDLRGEEFDFLHPFEEIRSVSRDLQPARAGRLKPWLLYHQAFLLEQELGPEALLAAQPGRLDIAPYQLVPVMRALHMSRPRLLLADGVGLGKTVEAGIVIAELIARRRAHRVLIVSPAGPLLQQWHREMRERFGLRFEIVKDWGTLQERRREIELGANPFDRLALCLTSIDFAKQEKVLEDLERASWDLAIIDEAHHSVRMGTAADREDSRRRRLAEVVARRSDGLLLLTATPHDGYDPHFASLMELLDPSLVDGRGVLRGDRYMGHVVRRLKRHIRDPKTRKPLFTEREVEPRPVPFGSASHPHFSAFQEAVLALVLPRIRAAMRKRRYGDVLAFVSLLKRSVSTVQAARNTIARIRDRFAELLRSGEEKQEERRQRLSTLRDYRRRLERYGTLSYEEEEDRAALEAEDMAAELFVSGAGEVAEQIEGARRDVRRERDRNRGLEETHNLLATLVDLADASASEDPKIEGVLEKVREIRAAEPRASVLIYTEYTDSQAAVVERLQAAVRSKKLAGEILALSGPDPERAREEVTERFTSEDCLILVSTDATAEGLNLHERCHHLLHVELPYNPNRLEQRNGRIDRYGQLETPRVAYLYLAGTFEERLLLRLVAKYERQRARLTFMPNTLGVAGESEGLEARLLEGLAGDDQGLSRPGPILRRLEEAASDDTASPAYKELFLEVERALSGFEKAAKTHGWLAEAGLNSEESLSAQAEKAREAGERLGAVDLARFVCAAIEAEAGAADAVTREPDGVLVLKPPPSWLHALEGLPGFDPEARTLRLATDPRKVRDAEGRPLGFLGRAHPIVRRALDRVRHIQFAGADSATDRRVSAVQVPAHGSGSAPELLFTFLGTVEGGAGREYERLLAVRVGNTDNPRVFEDPREWETLAALDGQIPTAGVWDRHFASWGMARKDDATRAAANAFGSLSRAFLDAHRKEIAEERKALGSWLDARAGEICGPIVAVRQADLFAPEPAPLPRWKVLDDPVERLAAFATGGGNPHASRREAEGVIDLFKKRAQDLDRREKLTVREPALLGLLMLVPEPVSRTGPA